MFEGGAGTGSAGPLLLLLSACFCFRSSLISEEMEFEKGFSTPRSGNEFSVGPLPSFIPPESCFGVLREYEFDV